MSIIRVDHSLGGWTAVPRAALEHPELSLEAVGLLGWLLVKPDDWEVRPDVIRQRFGIGREKWGRVTAELIRAGFYKRVTGRNARGLIRTTIVVSPVPFSPGLAKPAVGEPGGGSAGSLKSLQPIREEVKQKEVKENNNNSAESLVTLDLEADSLIVSPEKYNFLKKLLVEAPAERRQFLADEVVGQYRIRQTEIKNFGAFATSIVRADRAKNWCGDHYYSASESELRAGKKLAESRNSVGQMKSKPPTPMPPEIRAAFAKILGKGKREGAANEA